MSKFATEEKVRIMVPEELAEAAKQIIEPLPAEESGEG